jgi:hypothetical protein
MYKITGADGKEYGPIMADQLRRWIAEGRINLQTKILPEGDTQWRALSEFPEFVAAIPAAPPSLSSPAASGPGAASGSNAAQLVAGPAIGLIVVAALGCIVDLVSLAKHLGFSALAANQPDGPLRQMPWLAFAFSGAIGVLSAVVGILLCGLILFGALKMKKLENYGVAMAASIVALLPCSVSVCCVVGLPIGIWALVVLSKPEVKDAFH